MSLKRKASFPNIASSQSPQTPIERRFMNMGMGDSPKHLNCRTRKRVMNSRPDDQAVYDKTLRWLFTAQQRVQQMSTPPTEPEQDEHTDMESESVPLPAPDHRQQSLLQFFRPARSQQHARPSCPSTPINRSSGEPARGGTKNVSPFAASEGGMMTPSRIAGRDVDGDMDVHMDMDMGLGGGEPNQNPGWMR
ncbi:hypothetical protein BDW74DRAFT_142001 [Aspergillus multicolor]|uniref:uncharacterized protein n=1 Tax=Aspergillus multicolor TaxID=41759 RepID=UPI003CCD7115